MLSLDSVLPLHLADVRFPEWHPRAGETGPVYAFLILHPAGPVLIDTGPGPAHPVIDQMYGPERRPLEEALKAAGVSPGSIAVVVNTHLSFRSLRREQPVPQNSLFTSRRRNWRTCAGRSNTIAEFVNFEGAAYRAPPRYRG